MINNNEKPRMHSLTSEPVTLTTNGNKTMTVQDVVYVRRKTG